MHKNNQHIVAPQYTCDCCGSPFWANICPVCYKILLAVKHLRDTPKREHLHNVIGYIAKGVDD